jgi:hypothetical protein
MDVRLRAPTQAVTDVVLPAPPVEGMVFPTVQSLIRNRSMINEGGPVRSPPPTSG